MEQERTTWKGKTRGGSFGYWFFIKMLRIIGLRSAYFLLYWVVPYFVIFAPKASWNQFRFFKKAYRMSFFGAFIGVFRNYFVFGQVILDKLALMVGVPTQFTFDFEGEEHLHQMAAQGKGGLLVGAHIGNWEIAGHLLERIDVPVNILMLDAEHERIKAMLEKISVRNQLRIIPIKNDLSHLKLIAEAFERNELVAMHGDRFLGDAKRMEVPFFGHNALFPTGPFYMSMKYQVPLTFVSAMKQTATHYSFTATKPQRYPNYGKPQERDAQIKEILKNYIFQMEERLREYPYQWFNYYAFWKD